MAQQENVNFTVPQARRIIEGIKRAEAIPFSNSVGSRRSIDAIPAGVCFVVKLTKTGGSNGSSTTSPTYTYTVKNIYDEVIKKNQACDDATSMSPDEGRTHGLFSEAAKGLAYYNEARDLVLLFAFEEPMTAACPS